MERGSDRSLESARRLTKLCLRMARGYPPVRFRPEDSPFPLARLSKFADTAHVPTRLALRNVFFQYEWLILDICTPLSGAGDEWIILLFPI